MIDAKVMHSRLKPKRNEFLYSIYYLSIPLKYLGEKTGSWLFGINRSAIISFHEKDHGANGRSSISWIKDILLEGNICNANLEGVRLITMPRIFGYVFNPVSFWVVPNIDDEVVCIICEVNNTFGERHVYICAHDDFSVIRSSDVLQAKKMFHVSPFLKREGEYKFRFSHKENFFAAFIDYIDEMSDLSLVTSVSGRATRISTLGFIKSLAIYPFMTLKVIILIHFQALVILLKGIKFISKPTQLQNHITLTEDR